MKLSNLKDLLTCPMFYKDIWYRTLNWFNSPQQWVYDVVPRTRYMDQYQVIENVLYAAIVDFVEREKCFELIDWNFGDHKEAGDFIQKCYNWIKVKRPNLQKKIEQIINNGHKDQTVDEMIQELNNPNRKSFDEKYPNLNKLEKELKEIDDYFLKGIVKYRQYLWV